MRLYLKFAMFAVPLSLALISSVSAAEDSPEIARGGAAAGHGGGDFNRGGSINHNDNFHHNDNLNRDGYHGGYGGGYYNGGYGGGYGPVLLPDPMNSDQDVDSIYNQNLRNMRQTGQ